MPKFFEVKSEKNIDSLENSEEEFNEIQDIIQQVKKGFGGKGPEPFEILEMFEAPAQDGKPIFPDNIITAATNLYESNLHESNNQLFSELDKKTSPLGLLKKSIQSLIDNTTNNYDKQLRQYIYKLFLKSYEQLKQSFLEEQIETTTTLTNTP